MGGMSALVDKLPGAGNLPAALKNQHGDHEIRRMIALINSMTPQERKYPAILKGSRKKRVAAGAGLQVQDLNRLLKQHAQMSKMMKKMSKGGMARMMRGMQGKLPPGMGL
jgi:signal recognition particle subunit SRP54